MNMHTMKAEPTSILPTAPVIAIRLATPPRTDNYIRAMKETAVRVVPPLIVLVLLVLFWELLCRRSGSALPPPSKVFKDTQELIFHPFFDHGGIDKGMFWHLSAS